MAANGLFDQRFHHTSHEIGKFVGALALSGHDQVEALQALSDAPASHSFPDMAEGFVSAIQTIHPEFVAAALKSRKSSMRSALLTRASEIPEDFLPKLLDSHQLNVMETVAREGLIEFVPDQRIDKYATRSIDTATALMNSRKLTADHMHAIIARFYSVDDAVLHWRTSNVPSTLFKAVVAQLGVDVLTEVVAAAEPSQWWLPLLETADHRTDMMLDFFNAMQVTLRRKATGMMAIANQHGAASSNVYMQYRIMSRYTQLLFAAAQQAGRTHYSRTLRGGGPAAATTTPSNATTTPSNATTTPSNAMLRSAEFALSPDGDQMFEDLRAAVADGPQLPETMPVDPEARKQWLLTATPDEVWSAFKSNTLTAADLEVLLGPHGNTNTVTALSQRVVDTSNASAADDATALCEILLSVPDWSTSRWVRYEIMGLGPYMSLQDQVRVLPFSFLASIAKPADLHAWWAKLNPPLPLDLVLALAEADIPLGAMVDVVGLD